jgi:glycosyltransferase involved in cell wall biosynthesis
MTRILFILRGMVPPRPDTERDQFTYWSRIAEGEVLLPVWFRSSDEVDPHLRATFPKYRVGKFCYHQFLDYRYPRFLRLVARFVFYISKGFQLHREKQIDVILSYGTNLTGIAAVVLKWLTGAKLIAELPNVPENAYRYYAQGEGTVAAIKRFIANLSQNFVCSSADCLKLLYPWQLYKYPRLQKKRYLVFPTLVSLHTITSIPCDEKFILLVGFPWYTKGADILIRAFMSIAAQFPDWKLKLLGHYPERVYLEKLAGGSAQVEFLVARPNDLALQIIGACSVFVLASRTDAAPVVVREAMAARKPIIASDVGGVRYFVRDNETGLLFQSENVEELAAKLTILLKDPELRARLAARGYELVMSEFDENAFVRFIGLRLASLTDDVSGTSAAAVCGSDR